MTETCPQCGLTSTDGLNAVPAWGGNRNRWLCGTCIAEAVHNYYSIRPPAGTIRKLRTGRLLEMRRRK